MGANQTDTVVVPEPPAASEPPNAQRKSGLVAVTILVLVVYALSIAAYSITGKSAVAENASPLAAGTNGVNVSMDLIGMDTVKNQMTVRILLMPQGNYLDRANLAFAKPVRLTLYGQTTGAISREIGPGDPLGAIEVPMFVAGDVNTYPLDRYRFDDEESSGPARFLGLANLDAAGHPTTPVPLGVASEIGGIHGWAQQWNVSLAGHDMFVDLTIKRAGGQLAFVFVILVLMILLALLALAVSGAVSRRYRVVEPTLAGWFAALLFALIPLRNFLPGAPPIGSWIDVLVFFWVELAIITSMAVFVMSWLKFGRKPGD